ncbi:hypothetical protein [Streptomyces sp. NPDC020965]|uniref:hypothetical protein n=1 Tax=Streptomyces sp. NPDC020965 TaxID=3365105 RepID=UPI00379421E9
MGTVAVALISIMAMGTGSAQGGDRDAAPATETIRVVPESTRSGGADAFLPELPGAVRELTRIQQRIAAHVTAGETAHTFASYLDRTTGRIVLKSDAPSEVVIAVTGRRATAPLTTPLPAPAAAPFQDPGINAPHRYQDNAPFSGGAAIRTATTPPCTSGLAVKVSTGQVYLTTSASCFPHNGPVQTEVGATPLGTAFHRVPQVDTVVIGGRTYGGRIYVGGLVTSSTIPVASAGAATVGPVEHCYSGRTSGEVCANKVVSLNGQLCGPRECTYGLIVTRGGSPPQPGDQGAPFYFKDAAGAHVRGQVYVAVGAECFVTSWTRISTALGVSIVTG